MALLSSAVFSNVSVMLYSFPSFNFTDFANHRQIKYDSSFAIDSKQRRKTKDLAKHPTTLHNAGRRPSQLKTFSVQHFNKRHFKLMETSMFVCIKSHPHFTQIKL